MSLKIEDPTINLKLKTACLASAALGRRIAEAKSAIDQLNKKVTVLEFELDLLKEDVESIKNPKEKKDDFINIENPQNSSLSVDDDSNPSSSFTNEPKWKKQKVTFGQDILLEEMKPITSSLKEQAHRLLRKSTRKVSLPATESSTLSRTGTIELDSSQLEN